MKLEEYEGIGLFEIRYDWWDARVEIDFDYPDIDVRDNIKQMVEFWSN